MRYLELCLNFQHLLTFVLLVELEFSQTVIKVYYLCAVSSL